MNRKELKKRMLEKLDDDMPEEIIEKFLDFCFGTLDDIENEEEEIIAALAAKVGTSKEKSNSTDWPGPSPAKALAAKVGTPKEKSNSTDWPGPSPKSKILRKGRLGRIGGKSGIGRGGGIGGGGGIGR